MPDGPDSAMPAELSPAVASARGQSLTALLRRSARRHGDRLAVVCGETSWTYAEFEGVVERLAAGLANAGIGKGDRVALFARNSHAFAALRFAAARANAVLVPINFMLNAGDIEYILNHSGAKLLFVDASTVDVALAADRSAVETIFGIPGETTPPPLQVPSWDTLRTDDVPPPCLSGGDDLLQLIYTSGTESKPKGAMLSHGAVLWEYQSCIIDCEWTPDTVAVHAMPLFHCAQLDCMLGPALQVGACNVITGNPAASNIIGLLAKHRATSFFAPPTVWIAILRSPELEGADLSSLEKGYYGASIMPVEVLRELQERFPAIRLWNLYGQTEIAPVASVLRPEEHEGRLGSAGRPTQHVETRIVDDDMNDVATGEIGEIVHRSPQLLSGYWNDPERTAAAFAGGWFHSGDLGWMDADGFITVVDRKKDMIKSGGENVASREVEEAIYRHPAVSEVAVIGLPDPKWVEAVTAVVVLRPGCHSKVEDLMEHCAANLSGFKRPKAIHITETLPRNASGKILKRELRLSMLESREAV
ncbi:fatty acyl-CoA synthetase [Novosphingobium aquimarinum]|uniref:fatty acyl-CoA synthetase n=1 Tax=Novosphingobium aquimarinum TaxID=2682494 RepID=UPI001E5B1B9A|nr:fatty acyl-CoA synthetase [Novosphingobium aquimarinum]